MPRGRMRYVNGVELIRHPRIWARPRALPAPTLTGIGKLTCKPVTLANNVSIFEENQLILARFHD